MLTRIKERFADELPLRHLSASQFLFLLASTIWPWFSHVVFPGNDAVAFAPVFIFLPIAYPVGAAFMALLPDRVGAYAFGVSLTIFLLAYLELVSWRQARARKRRL
jgi:hypothetical protein